MITDITPSEKVAADYIALGLTPIPTKANSKHLAVTGSLREFVPDIDAFKEHPNITLRLGELEGGLVDVDFDWPEVGFIYDKFLPPSWSFGRKQATAIAVTHTLLRCPGAKSKSIRAPKPYADERPIVELLTDKVLAPGSVHNSSDPIVWVISPNQLEKVAEITPDALEQALYRIAGAALLIREWNTCNRHDTCFGLSGAMVKAGWAPQLVTWVLEAIARAAEDEQFEDRRRAIASTLLTYSNKAPCAGLSYLRDNGAIPEELLSILVKWWHLDDSLCGVEIDTHEQVQQLADKSVECKTCSDITIKPLSWLWPGFIPKGKLSIIAGDPGLGKSTTTLDLAARVSIGGKWPVSGHPCERGDVLILSSEDDAEDTIVPRLKAAGADLSRIHVLGAVLETHNGKTRRRGVTIDADIDLLEQKLQEISNTRLIIIDPISAHLGRGTDSHNDAEVRAVMGPAADLAQRYGIAVIGVAHLNKGGGQAIYRVIGSIAFTAAARAVYAVTKDPEDPATRLFLSVKNNLTKDDVGLSYTVATFTDDREGFEVGYIVWGDEFITADIDETMHTDNRYGIQPARAEAGQFILAQLSKGSKPVTELQAEAKAAGIRWRTVERAKSDVGARSIKRAGIEHGGWEWALATDGVVNDM